MKNALVNDVNPFVASKKMLRYIEASVTASAVSDNPNDREHGLLEYGSFKLRKIGCFVFYGREQNITQLRHPQP